MVINERIQDKIRNKLHGISYVPNRDEIQYESFYTLENINFINTLPMVKEKQMAEAAAIQEAEDAKRKELEDL